MTGDDGVDQRIAGSVQFIAMASKLRYLIGGLFDRPGTDQQEGVSAFDGREPVSGYRGALSGSCLS